MGSGLRLALTTKLPYREFPDAISGASFSLVFLNVQFSLPKPTAPRTKRIECMIDSGASSCLFHADIARFLGLDLKSGVRRMTNGIGGLEETWVHDILLFLPGGPVKISAGFKENLTVAGLLGMQGFFEHFTITFDPSQKQCILERIFYA